MPDAQPPIQLTLGRRQWGQWVAATALSGFAGSALAQETKYPGKAIRMVIPFTPGGSADILGRAIGHELTTAWGQSVVPENVAGAGGSIGADRVAKASADGYTLLMGHVGTLAITPTLYPKLPYDPIKSFTPLAWVARVPNVLVVHPSLPVTDLASFISYVKANPGAVNFSSGGNGSAAHMTMAYLSPAGRAQDATCALQRHSPCRQ